MKPITLKQVGSKWQVILNTSAAEAYGGRASKLKKYPPDAHVPVVRTGRTLDLVPDGSPGRFTKDEARHVAHMIGRYMLGFGDLIFAYVDEVRTEKPRTARDHMRRRA